MKFDKDGFNEFIQDEFSFDGATQRIINNLVEYGIKNLGDSEDKLVDFIQTIINDPTVEEIKQFVINEEKEELIGGILMDVRKGNVINTEFGETIVLDIKDNQATLFDGNQFILATGIKLNKKSGNYEWESVRYASDIKTIANMQNTDFKSMKNTIDFLAEYNYKEFVKGIVSLETGVLNEEVLNAAYDNYMSDSVMGLIDEKFMDHIDEQGQGLEENLEINQEQVDKESKDILNIDGNLASDIEIKDLKAKDGKSFKVASFSIAENDKEGNVKFTDCYAYDDKISQVGNMKKGDFVHLFGKGKTNKGKNGKEYRSIKIYSAKLLKAKEQTKDKSSTIEKLREFKNKKNIEIENKGRKDNTVER